MSDRIISNYLGQFRLKLSPKFHLEAQVLTYGYWEADVLCVIDSFVRPGDRCIDIGASAGYFTLAMAKQAGEGGRVIAFEPSSLIYPRLVDNINLNPGLRRFVSHEKIALFDKEQLLSVEYDGEDNFGNATLRPFEDSDGGVADEICLATTLDKILMGNPVDFIKVDVEGMELEVLSGATEALSTAHPVLYYETLLTKFDHQKMQQIETLLHELGYLLFRLGADEKFHQTHYPNYAINTLAVHRDKISLWVDKLRTVT